VIISRFRCPKNLKKKGTAQKICERTLEFNENLMRKALIIAKVPKKSEKCPKNLKKKGTPKTLIYRAFEHLKRSNAHFFRKKLHCCIKVELYNKQ